MKCICLSLYLSLSVCLSLPLSFSSSTYLYLTLFLFLSLFLSIPFSLIVCLLSLLPVFSPSSLTISLFPSLFPPQNSVAYVQNVHIYNLYYTALNEKHFHVISSLQDLDRLRIFLIGDDHFYYPKKMCKKKRKHLPVYIF